MNNKKYFIRTIILLVLFGIIRVLISSSFGLGDDEAHYWQYSRNINLSYYDHPPMVSYAIGVSTFLFGKNEVGIRLVAIMCFFISTIFIFLLAEKMYDGKTAFISAVLFQIVPVFFMGSILTIPDSPLVVFWTVFMYIFYRSVFENNLKDYYLLGSLAGLALLSKYTAIFLFISVIIFLLICEEKRYLLINKKLYFMCIISFIIFIPVILWNIEYNFASFSYQGGKGLLSQISPNYIAILKNLTGQIVYISPFLLFIFLFLIFKYSYFIIFHRNVLNKNTIFLLSFSAPMLLFFYFIGLFRETLPHWNSIGYIPVVILFSNIISKKENTSMTFMKFSYFSILFSFLLTSTIVLHALFKIIPLSEKLPAQVDITNELYGWNIAGKEIEKIIDNNYYLLTHKHYIASQLAFYERSGHKIYCINNTLDQYDFWQQEDEKNLYHKNFLFITDNRFKINPAEFYRFRKVTELKPLNIYRNKKPVRTFYFYLCEDLVEDNVNKNMLKPVQRKNIFKKIKEYDEDAFFMINLLTKRYKIFDYFMVFFTELGNGLVAIPLVFLLLFLYNRKNVFQNFLIFVIILLTGGFLIQVLKSLYNQPRPLKEFSNINILLSPLKEKGFPSGHSYTAFVTAIYLNEKIKVIFRYKSLLIFTIALLVCISRVYVGAHFFTDIIAGAIIGVFFTKSFLSFIELIKTHSLKRD